MTTPLPEPAPDVLDEVIDTRRHLHRHPEVAFQEHETSRFIRDRLAGLGLEVLDCPAPTGALALLQTGRPGPRVMLRADIDGLLIHEESGVGFASAVEGRMHACGHDAHTAVLVGTARTLAERAEDLGGSYLFCFQPAEEISSGARELLAGGLFERHRPDVTIGLHALSFLPSGTLTTRPGLLWAGADAFEIAFSGPGGHGALMKRTGNVLAAQAFLIERLDGIVEGLEHEGVGCHCAVGEVHSDGAWNIVPRSVVVRGSVRTFTAELRTEALGRLRDLLLEVDTEFLVSSRLRFPYATPPLVNDGGVAEVVLEVGRELIGERASRLGRPLTVSDDMAEYLTRIPGCYFLLGARPSEAAAAPAHHSPGFRIDESALATGVRAMAGAAARLGGLPVTAR